MTPPAPLLDNEPIEAAAPPSVSDAVPELRFIATEPIAVVPLIVNNAVAELGLIVSELIAGAAVTASRAVPDDGFMVTAPVPKAVLVVALSAPAVSVVPPEYELLPESTFAALGVLTARTRFPPFVPSPIVPESRAPPVPEPARVNTVVLLSVAAPVTLLETVKRLLELFVQLWLAAGITVVASLSAPPRRAASRCRFRQNNRSRRRRWRRH